MFKKINFYFIFLIILGFVFIPNTYALTCDINNPVINVESLPTASVDTLNNIYYYNGKFYQTNSILVPDLITVGQNLQNKMFYFNFPTDINFYKDNFYSLGKYINLVDVDIDSRAFQIYNFPTTFSIKFKHINNITIFEIDKTTNTITTNLTSSVYYNASSPVSTIHSNFSLLQPYITSGTPTYNYSFTTCDSSSVEMQKGKEIYLFFSSYDMKNLSIFENVDFSTFTSFQIILLTFGINFLFISILLFFFYIGYKLIFKLWSIVKCLL